MGRRLVSELEIRRVAREGKRELDVGGAVVTPSARDLAALLQVNLKGAASGAPKWPAARGAPPKRQNKPPVTSPSNPSTAPTHTSPPQSRPAIALGADHGGVALKAAIAEHLKKAGYPITDVGTSSTDPVDYPLFAVNVARQVAQKKAAFGIMVDGAGIGSCMAANKIAGVRAAMCYDVTTATNAREHNGANVLTLGGGLIGPRLALAIVDTFLATPFAGGRHAARVEMIDALDRRG
jgi:ribose 5-phosphate isomerase B